MIGQEVKINAAVATAGRNLEGNLRAIADRQPLLVQQVTEVSIDLEWVFGRDGSLTARCGEAWWAGCSLPRRTAQTLLRKMELKGAVICYLSPGHAGEVRVTLDRMEGGQALVAVVPNLHDLRVMLGCEDFAEEIRAGRLWFAWGEGWKEELERLLRENDGLPTPGQFIRTALVEKEAIEELIRGAQEIFSRETTRRGQVVQSLFEETPVANSEGVCVIAPGRFRPWEDIGPVLGRIAKGCGGITIDPDHPCQASPVTFARAAAGCGAVVIANGGRSDLPGDLPAQTRVISWITGPRIPRYDSKGVLDVLLVADERWQGIAIAAGWRAKDVKLAGWPVERRNDAGAGLGIIADTLEIRLPEFGLTSQKILWESIGRELSDDPFAVGMDAAAYLSRWLGRASISEETVDRGVFIDRLIVPAYQQGLARWLVRAGVEVKLFGEGWGDLEEFEGRSVGKVRDREGLRAAVEACGALVHIWPATWAHPVEAMGRAVLKRGSKSREMWLAEAKRLARGEGRAVVGDGAVMSVETVRQAIRAV